MTKAPRTWRSRPLWWWALWLAVAIAMVVQVLRIRIAEAAVDAGDGATAVAVRPQNGWGQALLAEEQLADKNVAAAVSSSRQALDRTPLAAVAVRSLARSLDSVTPAGGERAWQVASTMGWRDPPTQLWALLRALSNGQADIFVMRADALMRTETDDARMIPVIRQALIQPQIRQAFLQRIALDPQWRKRLFVADRPLAGRELEGTLLALRDLGRTSARPRRAELRDTIGGLIAEGRFSEALALDREFVKRTQDQGSLIDDGGFELRNDYRKDVTPFDWTIVKSAILDQSGGRKSMLLTRDERRSPRVRRFIALPAGQYRISYLMNGEPDSAKSLGVRIRCAGARNDLAMSPREPLAGRGWEKRAFPFAVPSGCPLTLVELTVLPGATNAEAQFDDFEIAPLGATAQTGPATPR